MRSDAVCALLAPPEVRKARVFPRKPRVRPGRSLRSSFSALTIPFKISGELSCLGISLKSGSAH